MRWLQKNTLQAYAPIRLADALTFAVVAPAARGLVLRRVHELALDLHAVWIVQNIALDSSHEATP